jgi:hypothetical protein
MVELGQDASKYAVRPIQDAEVNVELPSVIDSIAQLLRGIALIGVFGLLVTAAYYSLEVFQHVGRLVQDPATARPAVEAIADMISADQMLLEQKTQAFRVGDAVAFVLLMGLYLLWLYIPATIISVCSRVLLGSYFARRK